MGEVFRQGLDALHAQTELLQRVRSAHPTKGLYEAGELQFWWRVERSTDRLDQLFWLDDEGRPEAAATVTSFGDGTSLVYNEPILVVTVMPDASADWVIHVVERGLAHFAARGIELLGIEADRADPVMRDVLFNNGFSVQSAAVVECWLDADTRPEVSPLHKDYRLLTRDQTRDRPHHLSSSDRPDVEERLRQTPLYRSDLDLLVLDDKNNHAAHGLFWFDPVTATGVVEPMRTMDEHQQRGLARHILTAGVDLLAKAGATRISIGYEPDNPASGHLYRSVGFEPHRETDLLSNG